MWRNYLTVGLRSLTKNRAYALINILGLAIGMAACLLILLFVRYERSYDADLPGAENAYAFQTYFTDKDTGDEFNTQLAAYVTKGALTKDFPQIANAVHVASAAQVILRDGIGYPTEDFRWVDGNIFDILHYPFVEGDPRTALAAPGSAVLTQSEARKWFGSQNPMGRTLTTAVKGEPYDLRVTGVIRDVPKNSSFSAGIIARYDPVSFYSTQPQILTNWGWQMGWVYVRVKPGADVDAMNASLHAWEKRNIPDEYNGARKSNQGDDADFAFVNVRDIHLGKAQQGGMTPGNTERTITTFAVIALLILGMACVNFTNLATARAGQRAREVALRKVLGASRRQLVMQFIGESILVAALSMLVALTLSELVLPWFAAFLDADMKLHYFGSDGVLLPVLVLVIVVGIAGGAYPAFYLARFQPAHVLKANKSASDAQGSGRLRNILVVGQFAVSIGLIICTAVIHAQTVYARTLDPGFKREGLIQIDGMARPQLDPVIDTLIDEIGRVPGVTGVTRTTLGIATQSSSNSVLMRPGQVDGPSMGYYFVDHNFFDVMGVKLLAGRGFDEKRPMDNSTTPFPEDPAAEIAMAKRGANVVINELAVKRLGFASPADAIGKQLLDPVRQEYGGLMPLTIIGVAADTRLRSVHEPIDPTVFFWRERFYTMLVRYSGDPQAVRGRVEAVWKRVVPGVPFTSEFSEDIVRRIYRAEDDRATMFAAFASLAVIIGCLGLVGLAAFTAERRTKEIGIRKVLGASTGRIVQLLVWQFSRPVLFANLIAWPVAWWLMRDWLNGFDARIALGPVPFVGAGLLALLIAVGTIAAHSLRVARTNPIHALRYE